MLRVLPRSALAPSVVHVTYLDGRGLLREVLQRCVNAGFQVVDVSFRRTVEPRAVRAVDVELRLRGAGSLSDLVSELGEPDGVLSVRAGEDGHHDE
jgi:putative Mg2+ transporter-C (MgtC) family protein